MFHDHVGGSVSQFVLTANQFQWLFDLAYLEEGFVPNGPTGRPHVQVVTPDAIYYVSQQRGGSAIVTVLRVCRNQTHTGAGQPAPNGRKRSSKERDNTMKAATFTPREVVDGFTVVIRKEIYDHLLDAYDAAVKVVPQGSWARALDAALDNLGEAEEWLWRADDNTLRCASATTEGVTYDANPRGCTCKAAESGKACWHRAAALLALRTFERAYRANHYYLLVRGDERCRMVDATRLTKLHTVE